MSDIHAVEGKEYNTRKRIHSWDRGKMAVTIKLGRHTLTFGKRYSRQEGGRKDWLGDVLCGQLLYYISRNLKVMRTEN